MGNHFVHLIADLISLPMPTIAAVTGHAAAAVFMLAISHDYMEMRADRGFLYMSELELGMPIPPYFLALLKSKIPDPKVVRDMVLRSAKITADEASRKGIIDGAHGSAAETVAAAVRRAEDLAARNWNGRVYASIRRGALPEICRAVGLPEETEEERRRCFLRRLSSKQSQKLLLLITYEYLLPKAFRVIWPCLTNTSN
ncbi:hypothetical protein AXF42_Ash005715 [Apostasia shenzhenica]|uniref:Uncharacterized protein n=1 Tax=Apostasia shenzhenica TaxID=1088818 RepID=A0A2I0BC69_9ASPA|nr:hypothetical protein AXF42_Ash005715 [Apostasia shenzhenica]